MQNPRKSLLPTGTPEKKDFSNSPFAKGAQEEEEDLPITYSVTRKHRAVPFHDAYEQFTNYIHKAYQEPFKKLREELEISQTELHNRALYDFFLKHRDILEDVGIDVEQLPAHPRRKQR